MLSDMIRDLVEVMAEVLLKEPDMKRRNLLLFQKTEEYASLLCLLLRARFGDCLLTGLTDYTLDLMPQENEAERLRMVFWRGAYYNVLRYWLLSEQRMSAKRSANFSRKYMRIPSQNVKSERNAHRHLRTDPPPHLKQETDLE